MKERTDDPVSEAIGTVAVFIMYLVILATALGVLYALVKFVKFAWTA